MPEQQRADLTTEIAECIGEEAAEKIIAEYGGTKVYVPKNVNEGRNLAKIIGLDALNKLAETYGGTMLHIPAGEARLRASRNKEVIEARRNGSTIRQICKAFNLTERTVFRILSPQE